MQIMLEYVWFQIGSRGPGLLLLLCLVISGLVSYRCLSYDRDSFTRTVVFQLNLLLVSLVTCVRILRPRWLLIECSNELPKFSLGRDLPVLLIVSLAVCTCAWFILMHVRCSVGAFLARWYRVWLIILPLLVWLLWSAHLELVDVELISACYP